MNRMRDLAITAWLLAAVDVHGIKDKDNQGRWTKPTVNNLPDKEVPGFLVNLGPTGARAILTEKTFIVKYVFKGSPAEGRLRLDDVILGAFGKPFPLHTFGGSPHGYEGPLMAFGEAIERAEGKDGKLVLNVARGTETLDVRIDLEPIGAFSATFPLQCRKSELLRARALRYLADSPDAQVVWQAHAKSAVTLALLSSEVPAQQAVGKRLALGWNGIPGPGTWTWGLSFQLITLAEYHLLTGDAAVLPTIKALASLLKQAQYDGRILAWGPGDVKGDYAQIDASQQLYLGGFGHAPYTPGAGKNGYGPMQYTTIFAVIAWQLAERCGVKAEPRALRSALDFIHRGTNAAGYVAYGGEFTLNNGYVDPVAWKKSTSGDNYAGRAGASIVAHKLSPEFADAAEYAALNRDYLKRAYKSLPDGHADSNLGILWGVMGAAASEDETALRTVLDYHKAWFNMMRCHDGSFVLLPGRDYADEGYYMASRYHPTASLALVFGLHFPKLQIQGIQVSIPGLNPKALGGTLLAAYKAVVAKSYGQAARLLKSAGPEGASITAYLDIQARRAVDILKGLETSGQWFRLKEKLTELRKSFDGIAVFDEAAAAWDVVLKNSPLLAADRRLSEGAAGPALRALPTEASAASSVLRQRIEEAVREGMLPLLDMEAKGDWHGLERALPSLRKKLAGAPAFDEKDAAWQAALKTEPVKAALRQGAAFARLREAAGRRATPALLKEIEAFAAKAGDTCYGLEAKALLKTLGK